MPSGGSGFAGMVCGVSYRILSFGRRGGGGGTSKFSIDVDGMYST